MRAQVVKYSSVVGQAIMLLDEKGACVAQLSIHSIQEQKGETHKQASERLASTIASAINGDDEVKQAIKQLTEMISKNSGSGLLTQEAIIASDKLLQISGA